MTMQQDERKFYYDEGYNTVPPLLVDGSPVYSTVADSVALHNVEWMSGWLELEDAFVSALYDGDKKVAMFLADLLVNKVTARIDASQRHR